MDAPESMAEWPTGRLLSTAARLVEHAWATALDDLGLTHAGLIALHLLGAGPLSQTELAHEARVEVQTMSRTLERLEREGYIARAKHPADGRRHIVTRTIEGAAVFAKARTLEAELFPANVDDAGLRTNLLQIIGESSLGRFS